MSAFVYVNNSRMDLQCQMKDADTILSVFTKHDISFERKYTTLHGDDQPATITFVGLKSDTSNACISRAIADITELCTNDTINNVYLLFENGGKSSKKHSLK